MPSVRAAVMVAPHQPVELREFPEPDLEPNSALLQVECSEVCGTDVHLSHGGLAGVPYPIIPGHVSAGVLAKIRGQVLDMEGAPLSEGDRVTFLDVHATCNACWYCLVAKASTRCPKRKVYGITYGVEDGLCGGWAEKLYLKPQTRLLRLGGLSPAAFMQGGCALPTAIHALERAAIALGDTVLVLGSGPVGISLAILARLSGAERVLCIGAPDGRLQVAAQFADATLNFMNFTAEERRHWVLDHSGGRGADVTIEATGSPSAVVDAFAYARDAGRVVIVGQYTNAGDVTFNPHLLNRKHLTVCGCWGSDFSHFYRAVQVMSGPGRAQQWERLGAQVYDLAAINQALDNVAAGTVVKALVRP